MGKLNNSKGLSFWDLYQSVSDEEKSELIGHLLSAISGKKPEPIVIRKTFKISSLLSDEEVRKQIAENFDIDIERIPKLGFEKFKQGRSDEWLALEALIKDCKELILSSNHQASKVEELYDVGRFIRSHNHNLKIIVSSILQPYPDFILSDNVRKIGLEHTRLVIGDLKAVKQTVDHYIQKVKEKLISKQPDFQGFFNLFFRYDKNATAKFKFKENNKIDLKSREIIVNDIVNIIENAVLGKSYILPNYIAEIHYSEHPENKLEIIQAESYLAKNGVKTFIKNAIKRKEGKFEKYMESSGVDECWLLIVMDGVNGFSGFDLKDFEYNEPINSKFSKIYLLESFSWTNILLNKAASG